MIIQIYKRVGKHFHTQISFQKEHSYQLHFFTRTTTLILIQYAKIGKINVAQSNENV